MLLVNFLLQLLFLLEELFPENKVTKPMISLIFICLPDNNGKQGFTFFAKGQKPILTLFWLKSTKNNFAQGVPCEPEALLMVALGGLVYL